MPNTKGFDVSHHNGAIDWQRAADAGMEFTFIKATEGVTYVDPQFHTNWEGSLRAGLKRGAYHFMDPDEDGSLQADHFIKTVGGFSPESDLKPWIDLERCPEDPHDPESVDRWQSISLNTRVRRVQNFLDSVKASWGVFPVIYASPEWFCDTFFPGAFANYDKAWARYGADSPGVGQWKFWQYSENGSVPGVGVGTVDLDEYNGALRS
jgi:lysozyme